MHASDDGLKVKGGKTFVVPPGLYPVQFLASTQGVVSWWLDVNRDIVDPSNLI